MPKASHVSVRMYNVGLGDCFLIRFPDEERERKVLIDCGVHISGPGPHQMSAVVDRIIEDVSEEGHARIDVVIATHRHRDHVSGFDNPRWGEVEVGEVWLPWTEHPTDPEAKKIRDKQSKAGKKTKEALALFGASPALLQIVDNSLTNAAAMETLHGGWANKPKIKYLPAKTRENRSFVTDLLPGVTVHAMGPSRDPEVIRDMDPPKGGAYELRMAALQSGDARAQEIFPSVFELTGAARARQLQSFKLRKSNLTDLEKLATEDAFAVAVQLDKAVNGTSLMILFEIGRAHLLFPGDAQWGTWQNALGDPEFKELMTKTNFLKVGHHGSHNATPKAFVTDILEKEKFSAMVCTHETTIFKKIPLTSLLTALKTRSGKRIARSDQTDTVKGFKRKDDVYTDTKIAV